MPPSTAFPPGRMKILFFGYFCCFQSISKSLRNVFKNFVRDRLRLTLTESAMKSSFFTCLAKEKTPNAPTCATEVNKLLRNVQNWTSRCLCLHGNLAEELKCVSRDQLIHIFSLCNPHPSMSSYFLIKHR